MTDEYNYGPIEHELAGGAFADTQYPTLTEDERSDLYERAQDFVRTATVYDGLLRRLSNPEWDEFVERVGREVCEVVMRRVGEQADELEARVVKEEAEYENVYRRD